MKGEIGSTHRSQMMIRATHSADPRARWTMRSLSTNVVEDPRSAPFHLCQPGIHPDGAQFVERLRMAQHHSDRNLPAEGEDIVGQTSDDVFAHRPVMLDEVVAMFADVPAGVVVDATLGGGGHSHALLVARSDLKVLGVDRDPRAILAASDRLGTFIAEGRARVVSARFDAIAPALAAAFPGEPVVGVLFDLGVSSPQLDFATRGFSYRMEGPLDMRMDTTQSLSADDVVNGYDLDRLTDILRDGGEEKFARRVAKAIVDARPIVGTLQLADVARNAIPAPARRRPGDPAKRTFQAVRIEVNQELDVLADALDVALRLVDERGRVVTIAYHSGEDRIVKRRFVEAGTGGCICPSALPCVCGAVATHRVITKGSRKPNAAEVEVNPRAKSARLRAVEALGKHTGEGDGRMSRIGGNNQ